MGNNFSKGFMSLVLAGFMLVLAPGALARAKAESEDDGLITGGGSAEYAYTPPVQVEEPTVTQKPKKEPQKEQSKSNNNTATPTITQEDLVYEEEYMDGIPVWFPLMDPSYIEAAFRGEIFDDLGGSIVFGEYGDLVDEWFGMTLSCGKSFNKISNTEFEYAVITMNGQAVARSVESETGRVIYSYSPDDGNIPRAYVSNVFAGQKLSEFVRAIPEYETRLPFALLDSLDNFGAYVEANPEYLVVFDKDELFLGDHDSIVDTSYPTAESTGDGSGY